MKGPLEKQSFFAAGSVIRELQSVDKHDAIREVVFRSPVFRTVPHLDPAGFAETVIARERLRSTGLSHGVAVAHGRTPHVTHSLIALGVSRIGIDFDALDGQPVHLLFVVANHPDRQMDYLRILSTLVSLVRDDVFREELLECECREIIERKLSEAFNERLRKPALTHPA